MNRLLQKTTFLALFVLLLGSMSYGQIYVNGDASGANNGTSWADAYTDLQQALDSANAGDEIWVAAGTYISAAGGPDQDAYTVRTTVSLLGGFAGTETAASERDPEANVTILSGDINGDDNPTDSATLEDNSRRVVLIDTLASGTRVDGFTLSGGNTLFVDSTSILSQGGGLLALSQVVLENCTFTNNRAARGGGFTIVGSNTIGFRVLNCVAENNSAISGGGAYLAGTSGLIDGVNFVSNTSALTNGGGGFGSALIQISVVDTIRNCEFIANENPTRVGGIFTQDAFFLIEDCVFEANSSNDGAAIYVQEVDEEVTGVVRNCEFFSNVSARLGGAITIAGGDTRWENCLFENNEATAAGGGCFFTFQENETTILNTEMSGNTGDVGGAIRQQGGVLLVENCTVTDNEGVGAGGGIAGTFGADLTIRGGLVNLNRSPFGAGIFIGFGGEPNMLTMDSVLVQENDGNVGAGLQAQNTSIVSVNASNFEGNTGGALGGAMNLSGDSLDVGITEIFNTNFIGNFCSDGGDGGQGAAINNIDNQLYAENCVFAFNEVGADGIGGAISDNVSTFVVPQTVELVNNTFYFNSGTTGSNLVHWSTPDEPAIFASMILQNNIISDGDGGPAYQEEIEDMSDPNFVSRGGNIFYDESLDAAAVDSDQQSVADVGFVDAFNLEFGLTEESVAVNAGVNEDAPTLDITGANRLEIGCDTVDAGAYEYDCTSANSDALRSTFDLMVSPSIPQANINVEFNSELRGEVQILIIDMQGRPVLQFEEDKQTNLFRRSYNVSALAKGNYYIRTISKDGVGGGQFMIVK